MFSFHSSLQKYNTTLLSLQMLHCSKVFSWYVCIAWKLLLCSVIISVLSDIVWFPTAISVRHHLSSRQTHWSSLFSMVWTFLCLSQTFFLILSLACLWQHCLGIYIRFLSCTRKIKALTVTSLEIQVWFHSVSWFHLAITHGWPSFQTALLYQITPELKESCSFTGCFRIRAIWSHKTLAWYNVRSHFLGNIITVK